MARLLSDFVDSRACCAGQNLHQRNHHDNPFACYTGSRNIDHVCSQFQFQLLISHNFAVAALLIYTIHRYRYHEVRIRRHTLVGPFTPATKINPQSQYWPRHLHQSMYHNLQQRYHSAIHDIHEILIDMALDQRLMPPPPPSNSSVAALRSTASTPSLRSSREGSLTPMGRGDAPGGNVRVVVRVRGFLPRGMCYGHIE